MTHAPPEGAASPGCTTSELFEALWTALGDVIGSTATAALLQRSIKRAAAGHPELHEVAITCNRFIYTYQLPPSWQAAAAAPPPAFAGMLRELWPLLAELTGTVVVRRLREVEALRRCGVIPEDVES